MRVAVLGLVFAAMPVAAEPPPIDPGPTPATPKAVDSKPGDPKDLGAALRGALRAGQGANVRVLSGAAGEAWIAPVPLPGRHPAFGGGSVAGIVIEPPPHAGAKPYPEGMVITPPDVNDPMAIELGTNRLGGRFARALAGGSLTKQLSRGFQDAADAVWDLVLPITH